MYAQHPTKKIVLIRHGDTDWSCVGKHTGLSDPPLNKSGKAQAQTLKAALQNLKFQKVWVSPLKRALETCRLSGFSEQSEILPDLVEWNYGDYEGLTTDEIRRKNPSWSLFKKGVPHGESLLQISERADRVLKKVETCAGDVALFSSGHFLRVLTARYLSLPAQEGAHFFLSTASISVLACERENPVILHWNLKPECIF